jgi:Uma2 family endonuclease
MNTLTQVPPRPTVEYPDSDGEPMSDNTLQFEWITTIKGGLEAVFWSDPNVFVAGDLLWYPVEGNNTIRTAPDAMLVFGRPKGYRGSYKQWEEANVPPQVVFEVLSPGNRAGAMERKLQFYQRYGVEEYYIYGPEHNDLIRWLRQGDELQEVTAPLPWTSPRLKVRFELDDGPLRLYTPDGTPFTTYVELVQHREKERRDKELALKELESERQRTDRLVAQLRALGVEPHP